MSGGTRDRQAAYRYGLWGERQAEVLLRLKGYRILARREKTPVGEIDLIAAKSGTIVFVEVKARRSRAAAQEAIGMRQRLRIQRAAEAFLAGQPRYQGCDVRFDVVLVSVASRISWPQHMKDAWRP